MDNVYGCCNASTFSEAFDGRFFYQNFPKKISAFLKKYLYWIFRRL